MSPSAVHGSVYVLQYHDRTAASPGVVAQGADPSTRIINIYADLQDANQECLRQARENNVQLITESTTSGPDKGHYLPIEPLRWDTEDGKSCWVQEFLVAPKQVVTPPITSMPGSKGGRVENGNGVGDTRLAD